MRHSQIRLVVCAALSLVIANQVAAEDWPQFRGPSQQGIATSPAATTWSEEENVIWKTPIPGAGHSSPIILGDQIWVTTALSSGTKEVKDEKSPIPREVAADLQLHAVCLNRESGKIIHNVPLISVDEPLPIHSMNTYASPTPVGEPGRVYCHFGNNGTACVNTSDGTVRWRREDMKLDHQTGAGSSPLIYGDLLIFHMDGRDKQYIAGLNKDTGETIWQIDRTGKMNDRSDMRKAYSMPLLHNIGGEDILISPAADWVYGYAAATGEERWKVPYGGLGFSNTPRPVADEKRLYVCTGFMKSQMLAMEYDRTDSSAEPEIVWRYKKQVPSISSPLLVGKEIYFVADQGGVMTCVDSETGEMLWQERLSGNHTASPIVAGGNIYVAGRDGEVAVLRPGRKYDEIARNKLDSGILASPAVVDGSLFVRTEKALYRIE